MQTNDSVKSAKGAPATDSPYYQILQILHSYEDEVLEIEILGAEAPLAEGQIIIQDELCIGVKKHALVKAFIEARSRFARRHDRNMNIENTLGSTKVILLFDPEHLTAANLRKRHLVKLCDDKAFASQIQEAVQRELNFLNTVLTSPLYRQSKSPTLWYHRFWLLKHFILPTPTDGIRRKDVSIGDVLDKETSAVLKSAERHPLNYHAWLYLRRLVVVIRDFESGPERRSQLKKVLDRTLKWTLQHPGDVSGWSFLSFALTQGDPAAESTSQAMAEVEGFREKLQWKGEGLDAFLKQAEDSRRAAFAMDPVWKHESSN